MRSFSFAKEDTQAIWSKVVFPLAIRVLLPCIVGRVRKKITSLIISYVIHLLRFTFCVTFAMYMSFLAKITHQHFTEEAASST
ncbi:hypothetical protein MtrunA17_Chr4g0070251 [Medicago truncatula]|uniref:Transmembrane protein n=1 Tax=Medicago truncatula TaxID=3880 RepID=A0A396INR4_MEDTR|nr:hypothetical protein MtrunA17_Chr4g0070251 [Medicago truncatula]